MEVFIQNLINGVISGSYYAVLGVGLTVTWGVLKMINVAHGNFYMMGAYMFYTFSILMGFPVIPSIIAGVAVIFALGMLMEKFVLAPSLGRGKFGDTPFILTLAIGILLENVAQLVWGEKNVGVPYFNDAIFKVMGINMAAQRLIVAAVAIVTLMVVMVVIKKTKFGWAISATAQNTFSAALMGINTKKIYMVTFGIATALCAIAGCLLAPIYGINPWMGESIQLKSFVVCIVGGLGSVGGSIAAGLLLGVIESFATQFLGTGWQNVIAYAVVIVMFWFRPAGIFGKME
ncbi:MAG: branched-chain amino acid ABC transporter permease [Syntrophomonadaceae bacterium]|nr:branched-chain amino acid ABC transporter permease [Syntrophomonadaceae bacterium]